MSHINMAGMNINGGNGVMPGMPGMPLMNNGMNGATPRPSEQDESDYEARLNAYIYDYFLRNENWDSARSLINSGVQMQPPPSRDGDVNGTDDNVMQTDSKEDIDSKRPDDLPPSKIQSDGQGVSFLLDWFALFWDVYWAQRRGPKASQQATQYVHHSQAQSRLRAVEQQALLQNGMRQMVPNMNGMSDQQMMRVQQQMFGLGMNGDLRKNAMNNRNQFQPTSAQMAQMKQQQLLQQQMRRDPSDMDVNGQRPHTPSSGDNAPSPSKRPRLDSAPFNGQMVPNGRGGPLQGMPGQQMMDMNMQANQRLMRNGINPGELSQAQLASYQAQNPQIQEKSIQVYAQNLAKTQLGGMPRQGMGGQESPMMQPGFEMGAPNVDLYNQQLMRNGVPGPNGPNGGNHALQDYQMQLMLLEQQNKKRLLMARQEQDSVVRDGPMPGGPGGYAQGMSPSGSRSGPSPEPGMKRGTPKMGAAGLPTSPMPDGNMPQRSSPAAMGFTGPMGPDMYQNGGMAVPPNGMRMPSSHPGQFGGGPFNQQAQMEAMRAAQGRLPNGASWQQGPQGQAPMMQPAQPQQPQPMDTPQQRNAMPPPPAVQPGAATNGRPSPPAQQAPPTPQPSNKAPPKGGKKDKQEPRKRPTKKNSTASVAATPSGEAEAPPTPTPATPTITQHPSSFNAAQKGEALAPPTAAPLPTPAAPAPGNLPPPPDTNAMAQFGLDGMDNGQYNMAFGSLENQDVLDNFDFDSFLQSNDEFNDFDPTLTFNGPEGVEAGTDVV